MTVVTDRPATRLPMSKAELAADRPDDGLRYELLDGVLVVTPAPSPRHQEAAFSLGILLRAACPPESKVLLAPLDVDISDDTLLQPDVVVFRREQADRRQVNGAPLLAVEVLSPSTRRLDLHLKRSRYEAAGTASYWVVDPGEPPALTAWELRAGRYVEVASVTGAEKFAAELPFPVTVVPDELVDPDLGHRATRGGAITGGRKAAP